MMNNKIYDFENDATKKVDIGAFDTRNIGPDLELLNNSRERERLQQMEQTRTQQPIQTPIYPEPQEVIEIDDRVEDEMTREERAIEKTLTTELKLAEDFQKKKFNWMGMLFLTTTILLAGALIFVSGKYFAQVSENSKMKQAVQEAEDIKKNSNSKIETLTKQKEDIQTKMDTVVKEREELKKKYDESVALANNKQGQLDAANKANSEWQTKYDELQKQAKELQDQIDAIKKAAGA